MQHGYDACEIDVGGVLGLRASIGGARSRRRSSTPRPLAAFLRHVTMAGAKHHMAIGMLDHSVGIAMGCGAAPAVIHPGFLLGRNPEEAIDAVVAQLAGLREHLTAKGRAVPFGVEVTGRVQELGSVDDVLAICRRLEWAPQCSTSPTCMPGPMGASPASTLRIPTRLSGRGACTWAAIPHLFLGHQLREPQLEGPRALWPGHPARRASRPL